MSAANSETMPVVHNVLEAWNKHAPSFLTEIEAFEHAETSRLIKDKLEEFHAQLENPTSNAAPNFEQLKTDCTAIFANNLPNFQAPKAQKLIEIFFKVLIITTCILFAIGLAMMAQAQLAAFLGLITLAGFHFKGLAFTAASLGGAAATVSAINMFRPSSVAGSALDSFVASVQQPTPTAIPTLR